MTAFGSSHAIAKCIVFSPTYPYFKIHYIFINELKPNFQYDQLKPQNINKINNKNQYKKQKRK